MAKLQWNKSSKEFRETMGKFAVAVWELEDKKALYSRTYKARKVCLDTDLSDLEKLEKGEKGVLRDKSAIEKSIAEMTKTMEDARKVESALEEEIKTRMKSAYELVSETLFGAYENRLENSEDYDKAISDFLRNNGVEPTTSGIAVLRDTVGEKEVHGKKVVKDAESMGLTTHKKDAFCRLFLKGVAREMVKSGCLKTSMYAFEFVEEKKNK